MKLVNVIVMLAISVAAMAKPYTLTWQNKFDIACKLAPYLAEGSAVQALLASRVELHKKLIAIIQEEGATRWSETLPKIESLLRSQVFEGDSLPATVVVDDLELPLGNVLDLSQALYLLYQERLSENSVGHDVLVDANLLHLAGASHLVVLQLALLERHEYVVKFITKNTLGHPRHHEYELKVLAQGMSKDGMRFYADNHSEFGSQEILDFALWEAAGRYEIEFAELLVEIGADPIGAAAMASDTEKLLLFKVKNKVEFIKRIRRKASTNNE